MTLNPAWFLNATGQFTPVNSSQIGISSTTTTGFLMFITASTTANIAIGSTAAFFDGPSVSQGTSGTWYVTGNVTILESGGPHNYLARLWDGTTIIASENASAPAVDDVFGITLSGVLASPAGNLKISVRPSAGATGTIVFNSTGDSSNCSTITAIRIA